MIFLDTHVVVWLYAGLVEKFRPESRSLLNENELAISPVVRLELQYLHEIGRVTHPADPILADLAGRIGLQLSGSPLNGIVTQALHHSWTRDPFVRLIVATADLNGRPLLTADERILTHFDLASPA